MTRTLVVDIPRDYWLSMNRQVPNHAYRRRLIDALHDITIASAQRQGLAAPGDRVDAHWTIRYPKGVGDQADAVNAAPTTKAILDALCPRWLAGDDRRYVRRESFERGDNLDQRGGHVVILELVPCDARPGAGVA